MKTLYIIRHAKSSWSDFSLDDFDRPLNKRGKSNAPMMGERLHSKNIIPDLILSSPAKRAKNTAKIIAKEVGYKKDTVFHESMYEATAKTIDTILKKTDDNNKVLFLFGHNPDLSILAEVYVKFEQNIPTCGIVEIEFNCDKWVDISSSNAKLLSFDYPKKN